MDTILQALIMGIVQGLTEFLPVSSSGHLIVVPFLAGWDDAFIRSLAFSVMLHLGTLLALLVYFRAEWVRLVPAALATIRVYEEDDLIGNSRRLGPVMKAHHDRLAAKHASVGATRNLGLFGIIDLVRSRDPWTPLTPYNGTSDEMKAIGKFFRDNGLFTFAPNNSIHTNPPLCITEEQLEEGFEIIDRALDISDQAVTG